MHHLASKPLLIISVVSVIVAVMWFSSSHQSRAAGNTYSVATDGANSNPGTQGQPLRTIAQGISILQAGDTLQIRNGKYDEFVDVANKAGTSWSNPITIESYPGETAQIYAPSWSDAVMNVHGTSAYLIFRRHVLDGYNGLNRLSSQHCSNSGWGYTQLPTPEWPQLWGWDATRLAMS
jgi:Protein of unknown function (DUF1565)